LAGLFSVAPQRGIYRCLDDQAGGVFFLVFGTSIVVRRIDAAQGASFLLIGTCGWSDWKAGGC
jgi:hypothetical protein